MIVALANTTNVEVLAAVDSNVKSHAVWFQNFSTTAGIRLNSNDTADVEEFFLPPGTSATAPGTLVIQSSGGDSTLVNRSWNAYQASGGSINIYCGRW